MRSIKKMIGFCISIVLFSVFTAGCSDDDNGANDGNESKKVEKRNDMRIFVHYMPWFETKEYSGEWGMHWTMANCNPEQIDENGRRDIASHFYPLIGPYDSNDPLILDYHALLMKYAGIEGVLVDWYGSRNGDTSTAALMSAMNRAGLELAIVYEDRNNLDGTSVLDQRIKWGSDDMNYLEQNFFKKNNYITIEGKPLLLCFGPIVMSRENYANSPNYWSEIFASLTIKKKHPFFMTLYGAAENANDQRNPNVSGEFTWVNNDNATFLDILNKKYSHYMGSAYPGFHDYYKEGGWGNNINSVDYRDGQEFQDQLNTAESKHCPILQLVTWNDFGEGTQIEPTLEDGYKYLEKVQRFAQVKYDVEVFRQIYLLYTLRVKYKSDKRTSDQLNKAYRAFVTLEPELASSIMQGL